MKQSVIIHRPAGDIFTYLTDGEHLADWSSIVIAVRTTPSGPIQGGSRLRITTWFLGRWMETTYEVIECQPASHLTFKGTTGIDPCVFSFQFDATEGGTHRPAGGHHVSLYKEGCWDFQKLRWKPSSSASFCMTCSR
jgi:uncharacterized protein YndB with AHSA1/START domain